MDIMTIIATANQASDLVVTLAAVGFPTVFTGIMALGVWLSSRSSR